MTPSKASKVRAKETVENRVSPYKTSSPRAAKIRAKENIENRVSPYKTSSPRSAKKRTEKQGEAMPTSENRHVSARRSLSTAMADSRSGRSKETTTIKAYWSVKKRTQKQGEAMPTPENRYVTAKHSLSTAVPDSLIGRSKEMTTIKAFLDHAWVEGKQKKSLYMCGPPGTGKTACLKHLLEHYKFSRKTKVLFINCMSVTSTKAIFDKIASELKLSVDPLQAKKYLERDICSDTNSRILLVLDEIDQLDSKDKEVLYSIFEWPYLYNSRLVLIGIANALDIADRLLPRLKSHGLAPQELCFAAYTRQEIENIIISRLEHEEPIIKPVAIRFLAGKIAAVSGDVRKALDVCRRAIELTEIEHGMKNVLIPVSPNVARGETRQIDLPQVISVFNSVFSSRVHSSLKDANSDLPVQQKILIATILLMTNNNPTKCQEVALGKLQETYGKICRKRNMSSLDLCEIHSLCSLLQMRGFLHVKTYSNIRASRISLAIDNKEVQVALQDATLLTDILHDTACIAR